MRTLKEWKKEIKEQADWVDIKPYSHNIISIGLRAIAKKWGKEEANKTITELGLDTLGWKKEK